MRSSILVLIHWKNKYFLPRERSIQKLLPEFKLVSVKKPIFLPKDKLQICSPRGKLQWSRQNTINQVLFHAGMYVTVRFLYPAQSELNSYSSKSHIAKSTTTNCAVKLSFWADGGVIPGKRLYVSQKNVSISCWVLNTSWGHRERSGLAIDH